MRVWLALVAMTIVALAVTWFRRTPEPPPNPIHLNAPQLKRQAVYHQDEGVRLFPYDWFLALEQSDSTELFAADDNLPRYGFLPDPVNAKTNPDRLPVGFTKYDPKGSVEDEFACDAANSDSPPPRLPQLGMNCAACHTSELHYTHPRTGSRSILRIDGGPSMQDNLSFMKALFTALRITLGREDNEKFRHFAHRVLKTPSHRGQTPAELRACVAKFLLDHQRRNFNEQYPATAPIQPFAPISSFDAMFPLPWGFGRLDAFGRGGNTIFAKLDPDNLRPAGAPVSIPPVWSTVYKYDKWQWTGAVRDLRARYIVQALALNAPVRLSGGPAGLFSTGFDLKDVKQLADQYENVPPPVWPFDIFDDGLTKAERGRYFSRGRDLYQDRCAGCHVPKDTNGRLSLKTIPVFEIGTDPTAATSLYDRTVKTGILGPQQNGKGGPLTVETLPAVKVGEYLTTRIMEKHQWDARGNTWIARLEYLARPHAGVWATAPFLHNGSIPNLYLLLSPKEERDAQARQFCLGNWEFDPRQVGFTLTRPPCAAHEMLFDATLRGNWNTGHEYRNDNRAGRKFSQEECEALKKHAEHGILGCELTRDDRLAIVEYLKTL
jgi:hypothetical protein